MKVLYIGQYSIGSTSKMRADVLNDILKPSHFDVIDTHVPFYSTTKLWRSIGFRYKLGPLISKINSFVLEKLNSEELNIFDLIWIDKGVFITEQTLIEIRNKTYKLVHFTPDMAFYHNGSKHFNNGLNLYDLVVTTKSIELPIYEKLLPIEKLLLVTQGYSRKIHISKTNFKDKYREVVFVGLAEPNRIETVSKLINSKIQVSIAGMGWEKFYKKNIDSKYLEYVGTGLFGDEYAKFLSSGLFGLGLLSKMFPELHTTRTFEIPACGTALITERNKETLELFKNDEVLFFDDFDELIEKLKYFISNPSELKLLTRKGHEKVANGGFEYGDIMSTIIERIYSQN